MAKGKRVQQNELHPEIVDRILADIARWKQGLWAEENAYGPACVCGLRSAPKCYRHPGGRDV